MTTTLSFEISIGRSLQKFFEGGSLIKPRVLFFQITTVFITDLRQQLADKKRQIVKFRARAGSMIWVDYNNLKVKLDFFL